jgi:hypothetical protein
MIWGCSSLGWGVAERLNPHPSHETKTRRMGHPEIQIRASRRRGRVGHPPGSSTAFVWVVWKGAPPAMPPLEPGAMSYMMSPQGYLNDGAGHWVPHLMFYVPLTDPKSWGADLPGTPVMMNPQFQGLEPITEYMIPVLAWSDGTAAPKETQ